MKKSNQVQATITLRLESGTTVDGSPISGELQIPILTTPVAIPTQAVHNALLDAEFDGLECDTVMVALAEAVDKVTLMRYFKGKASVIVHRPEFAQFDDDRR